MSFEITGKLFKRNDAEQVTDSFKKREFVILVEDEKDEKYNQYIKFELLNDNCDKISAFGKDQEIKVSFNIRGREWNGKFFTNLIAWRIEAAATIGGNEDQFQAKKLPVPEPQTEDKDALPF